MGPATETNVKKELDFDRIHFELIIGDDGDEPSQFIEVYDGKIFGSWSVDWNSEEDNDEPEELEVGNIHLFVVEASRAINEGEPLFEVMDCLTSETADFHEAIFEGSEPRESVLNRIDENRHFLPNAMLIGRLELKPEYRGYGLGAKAAHKVIHTLGSSCQVIACKPFPLQYQSYMDESRATERNQPDFEVNRKAAWRKVQSFWSNVGFVRVPKTEYFVWPD